MRNPAQKHLPAAIVFAIGIGISWWAACGAFDREQAHARLMLSRLAAEKVAAFNQMITSTLENVRSIGAFFDSSVLVERYEFQSFTKPLLAAHPEIQALEWIPRVPGHGRQKYEESVRQEAPELNRFGIKELDQESNLVVAGVRPEHFPVHYVEPLEGNERAVGFDLASNTVRRLALEKAAYSGNMAVTGRIRLVQEGHDSFAVLVFHPVYDQKQPRKTAAQRRAALKGFALAVVRIEDLVTPTLLRTTTSATRPSLALFDESAPPGEQLLFMSQPADAVSTTPVSPIAERVPVADRWWQINYDPMPGVLADAGWVRFWTFLLGGALISLTAGAYLGSLCNRKEHTEKIVLERTAALENTKRALQEHNSEIASFHQTISHELKTPLACIHEFLSLVLEDYAGPVSEDQRELLEIARESGYQMRRCIDDLLDASRIETGKLAINPRPTSIEPIIESVVASMKFNAREGGIAVTIESASSLPDVNIDEGRITQVLRNLMSNALKFTPSGGRVTVTAARDTTDPDSVRVSVADTGPGIPEDQLERIFERSYQVLGKGADRHSGLGLGLSICKELVARHGGQVTVTSEVGAGSTFTFTVPVALPTLELAPSAT